jgi:hypothetical protein
MDESGMYMELVGLCIFDIAMCVVIVFSKMVLLTHPLPVVFTYSFCSNIFSHCFFCGVRHYHRTSEPLQLDK